MRSDAAQRPMTEADFDALVRRTEGLQPLRRVFHAFVGLVVAWGLWALQPTRSIAVAAVGSITLALWVGDLTRLRFPQLNRLFFRTFRVLASPREASGIASSTWYLTGVLVVVGLFPLSTAILAIVVLALADPAANYIGRRWGRRRMGTGTLEGALGFTAVASLILIPAAPPLAALTAATAAAFAEILPWKLDDNLVIPVVVAAVLWLFGAG